jgi:branched-chain amino acid transport system ATP-binding protein
MLDEPTLGLAPVLVAKIFETVRVINGEGVTVLLVEQNVRQALTLAHRACVLESGRLVLQGPGTRPAERRTPQACLSRALGLGPGGKV